MPWAKQAALATSLARDQSAWTYGSLALVALDHNASPLLLISELADHTQNIKADPRVARRILALEGEGWQLVGVDPEGCDLRREASLARADFDKPVTDAEGARVELVRLTKRAQRQRAADPNKP